MSTATPRRGGQEEEDSFSSLSSPMSSPPASPSAQLSNENSYAQEISKPPQSVAAASSAAMAATTIQANPQPQEAPARKKPGRKPKPVDPNDPIAVKKALRNAQRTAKRQSAKEAERNNILNNPLPPPPPPPPQSRKRKSNNNDGSKLAFGGAAAANQLQTKITDMGIRPTELKQQPPDMPILKSNVEPSQNGKSEDIPKNNYAPPQATSRPLINRSASGQNYDPIRSSNYDPVRETVINHNPPPFPNSQASPIQAQSVNRASASPSISSLVDPPNHVPQSPSHQSFFNQQARLQHHDSQQSIPPSPTHARLAPSPMIPSSKSPNPPAAMHTSVFQTVEASNPVVAAAATKKQLPVANVSTASSSTAHSPKPFKSKDPAPPPLPGSGGILQNGMFGGVGTSDGTEFRAPTVILHIPMNGDTNKYVNFIKMAEEAYGWDALHPRLAAQRDRLARVAAAGAALEKSGAGHESGDEMSLDLSEGEGSNVEMGGMSDGRTGTDGGKKVIKKRKNKEDEYDKDDGFVDDSDLLWEQQAAASKDGFFVYSGPLIPEGEKPVLDRNSGSDGSQKRGRGRGRGGSTRTATGARSSAAVGVVGPRGGAITRKPRITKAEREKMQLEKQERERMGVLTGNYAPNMPTLASAASNHGGTQMIFN